MLLWWAQFFVLVQWFDMLWFNSYHDYKGRKDAQGSFGYTAYNFKGLDVLIILGRTCLKVSYCVCRKSMVMTLEMVGRS